jgi:nicotinamidase-related amidase
MSFRVDLASLQQHYVDPESIESKTAEYLEELSGYNQREVEFDISTAALVLVDLQRCFLDSGHHLFSPNCRAALPAAVALVEHFRACGRPVIHALQKNKSLETDRGPVLSQWWPSLPREDAPDTEPVDEVRPLPEEKVVPKRRYSGFYATDLELTLRAMDIRQVVVAGVFTNVCVEATVRDAFMRDFFVFMPADATAAHNEQLHLGSLRTMAMWFARVCKAADLTAG